MSGKKTTSFSIDDHTARQLELLAKDQSKSAIVRKAVDELYWKEGTPMTTIGTQRSHTAAINKSEDIVGAFINNAIEKNDGSWQSVRKQAGELLVARAAIKHPTLTPPEAMVKVAGEMDQVDKMLYRFQTLDSDSDFAQLKSQYKALK